MIRPYQFILLCLLCGALTLAVKVRDAQLSSEIAALRAHVAVLHTDLETTNTEVTDWVGIFGGKVYDIEEHVGWLDYEIVQLKQHEHNVRPVPAFARDSQLVGR